jgi:single-strand DNA-binding protein
VPNFSSIVISGHLGRDAELKDAKGQAICEFSVAVTTKKKGGDSTAWYRCQLWGSRGEKLAEHLTKGTAVIVSGELVPREYKGKNDELRTSLDINVSQFSFAGGKGEPAPAPSKGSPSKADYDDETPF